MTGRLTYRDVQRRPPRHVSRFDIRPPFDEGDDGLDLVRVRVRVRVSE